MNGTITVVGNIATTPENKVTSTGVQITTFRVASTHRRLDRVTGRWEDDHTNWFSVSTYRDLADHAFRSLRKGDRVVLTGRLKVRNWDNGTRQGTAVDIDADAIGHDLKWGTTVFSKAERRGPAAEAPVTSWSTAPLGDGGAASGGSGGWGVPGAQGADREGADSVTPRTDDARDATGPLDRQLVDADTPF